MVTREVKRVGRLGNYIRLNVQIPYSLDMEIRRVCEVTGQSKVDAVTEAIRYWLNTQYGMGVK